jgi:hypothetical protein
MRRPALACVFGLGWAAATVFGCGGESGGTDPAPTTSTTSSGTGTGGTTFVDADACMASEECATTGVCVAAYDPAAADGGPGRGASECLDVCIEQNDLVRWCFDDDACCGELRCNAVDGFCQPPPFAGTTGGTSTGETGSSGSTGASDSLGSSGSSGSSGSGSTTGG